MKLEDICEFSIIDFNFELLTGRVSMILSDTETFCHVSSTKILRSAFYKSGYYMPQNKGYPRMDIWSEVWSIDNIGAKIKGSIIT